MSKVVVVLVVVFLGFWMFTDPSGMADVAQSSGSAVWGGTTRLFGALIDFIGAL
ncbi:MAG: hypothetical protein LH468_00055 [Nocardioides sp.]|nr:hypothetical protein [Nocardioides sp.]